MSVFFEHNGVALVERNRGVKIVSFDKSIDFYKLKRIFFSQLG